MTCVILNIMTKILWKQSRCEFCYDLTISTKLLFTTKLWAIMLTSDACWYLVLLVQWDQHFVLTDVILLGKKLLATYLCFGVESQLYTETHTFPYISYLRQGRWDPKLWLMFQKGYIFVCYYIYWIGLS